MARKKERLTKKEAQVIHAKRRALERYGLHANAAVRRELVSKIRNQEAELLERQSLRVGKYKLEHDGEEYTVIYDRKRKTIVTFLPRAERRP